MLSGGLFDDPFGERHTISRCQQRHEIKFNLQLTSRNLMVMVFYGNADRAHGGNHLVAKTAESILRRRTMITLLDSEARRSAVIFTNTFGALHLVETVAVAGFIVDIGE